MSNLIKNYDGKKPNLVITKNSDDFEIEEYESKFIYRIPAYAFLYLLGYIEYNTQNQ